MTDVNLEGYRGWLRKVAAGLASDPQLQEDLAQEGWIAMWRAARKYQPARGALPDWLTRHALWRMRDCAKDRAWLGRPARNQGSSPVRDVVEHPVADDKPIWDLLLASDVADGVLISYHHGEIMDAISALSPAQRRYVYLRFWCGYQRPDLVEVFGYDPSALWTSARNGAKLKLRESLRHLVAV